MPPATISAIRRALAVQGPQIQAMATLLVAAGKLSDSAVGTNCPLPDPEGTFAIVSSLPVIYGRPLDLIDFTRKSLPVSDTYIVLVRWKRSGLLGTVQLHRTALSPEEWSVNSLSIADSAVALHSAVSRGRGPGSVLDWLFVCSPLRFQAQVRPKSPSRSARVRVIKSGITNLRSGPWFGIESLAHKLAFVDHRLQRAVAQTVRRTAPKARPIQERIGRPRRSM
jgi:hypothetical protein